MTINGQNQEKVKRNVDGNEMLKELIQNQLKGIEHDKKLQYTDLKRICKYINSSMFNDKCCVWTGYVTNVNNLMKGTYINFYFRKKKAALHRLLYINFIGELDDSEYLKFSCDNKGMCCNINHLRKFRYQNKTSQQLAKQKIIKEKKQNDKKVVKIINDSLSVSFN